MLENAGEPERKRTTTWQVGTVKITPWKTVNRGKKEGSLMLDIIVLALALLLSSGSTTTTGTDTHVRGVGNKPPAGGIPIPQRSSGLDAQ